MQWTYRLNVLDVGLGLCSVVHGERPIVAEATGEVLSTGIGAKIAGDWGVALDLTLARVSITGSRDLVGSPLLAGLSVTNGVGSARSAAIPVMSLNLALGLYGGVAEVRAEWNRGILRPGLAAGVARYVSDANVTTLAPFLEARIGLGGWSVFEKRVVSIE